jgi:integrase/recombinase XerD
MTDEGMTPLRRRMIEDMTVRKFVEKTQKDYIRHVKNLTIFLGRSPDTAAAEDLRLYQLHLTDDGVRPPTINGAVSALRFFFSITLDRPEVTRLLTFVAEPRKIPVILSTEEVARFLEAAPGPKYKAALSALWGGPARFRGRRAEGVGYRLQAHAAADRAGQGAQGSLCDALPTAAGTAA